MTQDTNTASGGAELQLADAYAKAHAMYCMEDLYGSSKSYTAELLKSRIDARNRLAAALASAASPANPAAQDAEPDMFWDSDDNERYSNEKTAMSNLSHALAAIGVKGERYPCKPDIFEETYSPAALVSAAQPGADERRLRRHLCAAFEHLPYMDDGEAQGQSLDWLRCTVDQIEARIMEIRRERFAASTAAPAQQPAPSAAAAEIEALRALSVTNIMLNIVPGLDGMGHEVYAESVKDVEDKLSAMGQELEDWQLGIRLYQPSPTPQADSQPAPVLDSLALMTVVMQADEALVGRCTRGTTNWAAAIGKAVQDAVLAARSQADSVTAPAGGAVAGPVAWPTTCDGKEQEAWEAWAQTELYDMTQHPLHYLFLNERTYAARQGWKAGLLYAVEQMKAASPPHPPRRQTACQPSNICALRLQACPCRLT